MARGAVVITPGDGVENPPSGSVIIRARRRAVYAVRRVEETIQVDGHLAEGAWSQEPTFEVAYETSPAENGPAPVSTRVWLTYDDHDLYVAFRALDPQPEKIRARLADRDSAYQDDFVGIVLDTFNDERRGFEFFVNPVGVQMDLTQNELTGNEDDSWDAIWDSVGRVTDEGYDVEMRVPFSSLRFPRAEGEMTWGVDAVRMYPRGQRHRIALHRLERGNNCYLCQANKLVGFENVEPARSIELDPTVGEDVDFANGRQAKQLRLDPGLRLEVGQHLRLNLDHSFERLDVDEGELFTANLSQLRATYQINVRTFVRWIGECLDLRRAAALYEEEVEPESRQLFNQLLFSCTINPQSVLFLGYSDTSMGNQGVDPTRESRTLFLKIGYAWLL